MVLLRALSALALLAMAVTARAAPGMTVYVVDGLSRVRPGDQPGKVRRAALRAARNEYEPFQVVVHAGDQPLRNVSAAGSDLRGPGGRIIPKSSVTLYREHYLQVRAASPKSQEGPGLYPDALIPFVDPKTGVPLKGGRYAASPFQVAANSLQPVWVDVFVPKDTPPGPYSGAITVTADGRKPVRVPVELTVWPFTLPDRPSMRSNFGGFGGRVAEAFGLKESDPAYRGIERRFAQALAEHRICPPIPWHLYPKINPDGSVDPTAAHAALKEWIEKYHVTGFPLQLIGEDPLGKDRGRSTRYLQSMYAYLKANGWEKLAYIYVLDEPNDAAAYEEVRRRAKLIHEAQPGIKVLCTEQPTPQEAAWGTLVGAVDIWVPLWPLFDEKSAAARLAAGEEMWSYTALCQGERGKDTPFWELDFPLLNYRIPLWQSWRYGLTGLLYWTTVYWEKAGDPWVNPLTYGQFNEEGSLLYPGAQVGYDGPVASMRLKQIREGLEDYEYLKLLAASGDRVYADQIARRLARSWTDWDSNPADLYAARDDMARRIVARITQR